MTAINQIKLCAMTAMILSALSACQNETVTTDKIGDSETDADVDSDTDTDSDIDTDTGSPPASCETFLAYADECGVDDATHTYLSMSCDVMNQVFTDNALNDMLDCFGADSCADFLALLASQGDTDTQTDTETANNPFSTCFALSLLTAEPEQANLDFHAHFCEWAMQCDGTISQTECNGYFQDPNAMLLFNVIDTPYITDADACVYPMPACTDDVTGCLQTVTNDIGSMLAVLGQ
jgi:hypothetical protein